MVLPSRDASDRERGRGTAASALGTDRRLGFCLRERLSVFTSRISTLPEAGSSSVAKSGVGKRSQSKREGLSRGQLRPGERKAGRVFEPRTGTPLSKSNVWRKLNQILKKVAHAPRGLHAFWPRPVSVLPASGVPDNLVLAWADHFNVRTASRCIHFRTMVASRSRTMLPGLHKAAGWSQQSPTLGSLRDEQDHVTCSRI
jgi:hypothetical protein